MKKLFGTDGIRGKANQYPIIPEIAVNIGKAVAACLESDDSCGKIVIGRDPRISGLMIEHALVSGICSMGKDVLLAGILPTPAMAHLVSYFNADAAVVISASHNPYFDNGIKIFKKGGLKLSDDDEDKIEKLVLNNSIELKSKITKEIGVSYFISNANVIYTNFLLSTIQKNKNFNDLKLVIDCSNGATSKVAPMLFSELNIDFNVLFNTPDGKNINKDCGSQSTQSIRKRVVKDNADVGFAFDGDGDRLIAIDEQGSIVSGDQLIAICAKYAKENGTLVNNTVVTTVMSNIGLSNALKRLGIKHVIANVGDREVLKCMIDCGGVLGGEDSGHMIFRNYHTTGDGLLSSLRILEIMEKTGKPLSQLSKVMDILPQVLINISVKNKPDIYKIDDIKNIINSVENELGEQGRVLVRYSGTQLLCRVMVEGPTKDITNSLAKKIAQVIEDKIGIK